MDDLDDVLNDLLAEDPVPKKKPAPSGGRGNRAKGGARKPSVHDDDFYKSLAANAGDSMSDVSDADPVQMAGDLEDLDDMDAALFGPKKTPPPKTPPPKTPPTSNKTAADPAPTSAKHTAPASKPSPVKKKDSLDFDYDDPLADLLSDDDDDVKPAKGGRAAAGRGRGAAGKGGGEAEKIGATGERPSTGPTSGEDSSSESRRLQVERPPTRSGTKAAPAKKDDGMFDDEDVLGGLGFDDSPRVKPAGGRAKSAEEAKGISIMDDLLGKDSVNKHLEAPGSGGGGRREFVLDKRYQKQEAKPKSLNEDDFNFGGYMPSAATTPGSRPSSKRSVRFEDDDDDDRPVSRGRRGGGAAAVLEDMLNKDDRDWLDIASGGSDGTTPAGAGKKTGQAGGGGRRQADGDRPHSEGSARSGGPEMVEKPGTAQSTASEPVDWLGLSRLGSPKHPVKDTGEDDDDQPAIEPPRPRSGGRGGIPKEVPEPDDWLGTSSKKTPAAKASTSSGMDSDWLGLNDSPAAKESDSDDWLGLKSSKGSLPESDGKSTDWLGFASKDSPSKNDGAASGDYLGLGSEIEDPFKSASKSRADERGLDLFSPPPTKETSSSFPWDGESSGSRRRGRSRTPQKGNRVTSPQASPARPASPRAISPRGLSPADSPRDLMATLDALKKMDQKKATPSGPIKATPVTASSPAVAAATASPTAAAALPVAGGAGMTDGIMSSMMTSPSMTSSHLDDFKRQEEAFQRQQQALMEQQQKQQMERQRILAEQQERSRQQMQQMAEAQQQMLKQQMQQMQQQLSQPQPMAMPMSMPMPGFGMGTSSMFGDELMGQVKRLEMEKMHLMTLLETAKHQHQEERNLLEESHKKRMEMSEESWSRREQRLKEENEFLGEQLQSKLKLASDDKAQLIEMHQSRMDEWEQERRSELERLREQHREDLRDLRKQHEESLERVRKTKDLEIEAVANQHSTSRSLHEVLDKMSQNARDLDELQSQVAVKHNLSMDEREVAARSRDEQLKNLQERLERQHHDNEKERARLQGLLSKMEAQLTEQVRSTEEDKWRVRQEEARFQAAQEALEKEKTLVMQQFQREREGIQRSKDQLLEEQKSVLAQLYEERRQLAQERASFEMNTKLHAEKTQRENIKNVKTGAELEGSVRILNDEKARLAEQLDALRTEREQLSKQKTEIEQQRQSLAVEKEKLETFALQTRQRSKEIEDMCLVAAQARESGESTLNEAKRLERDQVQRLNSIQAQLQTLRTKERQIAQERITLAKEKQKIEEIAKTYLCVNCRTPVRDSTGAAPVHGQVSIINQPLQATPLASRKMSPAAVSLFSALDPDLKAKVEALDSVSAEIEMDRSIRMWRIAAKKDEQFLSEESVFLSAIRHSPYGDTSSKS